MKAHTIKNAFRGRLLCLVMMTLLFSIPLSGYAAESTEEWERAQTAAQPERVVLAIQNLIESFGEAYPDGAHYLEAFEAQWAAYCSADTKEAQDAALSAMYQTRREALLANPLLDFDHLLVLQRNFSNARDVIGGSAGHPDSFSTEVNVSPTGWDNHISIVSNFTDEALSQTVFKPERGIIVRNLDLHFDGQKVMFSSVDENNQWALFELELDSRSVRQLTPPDWPDVAYFDSCYLPDGRIITASTASYGALDCVGGTSVMSDLYLLEPETQALRQLTFDQVHPQHPAVRNDGTVMYMRWEYSDLAHYFSRFLFTMNPDGTGQRAFYGSGSLFPTAIRHARSIPGHPTKMVVILGGHHGIGESGRLAIIDPALARAYPFRYTPDSLDWADHRPASLDIYPEVLPASKTGFVQEIPGYGKDVVGNVRDNLVDGVWPHFTHPYPLSEHHFLVSMKRDPQALWGIYLVDIFDNMTLLIEAEGAALFDPIPLRPRKRPPVIPDRVDLNSNTATMLIQDIYKGDGLAGIPRGTVDRLRIFAYHFAYSNTGNHHAVSRGVQGPWDVRRILGTVPVEKDGSAYFEVPADTPVSIQPIDKEGRALQLMRSWTVGMPGERVSCIGCHEDMNQSPPDTTGLAFRQQPRVIEPWFGPPRPYAYEFEVQPVLERHCVGCHNQQERGGGLSFARNDLSYDGPAGIPDRRQVPNTSREVEESFDNLNPFARRPGPESQLMIHEAMEFHASTSPLIQMLEKGHFGVKLEREDWERLYTWIDLNTPFYGRWNPPEARGYNQVERRINLARQFGTELVNPEAEYEALIRAHLDMPAVEFIMPAFEALPEDDGLNADAFTFSWEEARTMQTSNPGLPRTIDMGAGQVLTLQRIPAGRFIMGSLEGYPDEQPRAEMDIEKAFWMSEMEITNAQYAMFDPEHDTGYHQGKGKDKAIPGKIANHPNQPVTRVNWEEAMAFCAWLSEKTGLNVTLPTEVQWEWAARAGTSGQFYWGDVDDDFSLYANLSDRKRLYTRTGFDGGSQLQSLHPWDPDHHYPLRDDRFDDGALVTNYVGQYAPNAWGLYDMIGNVSEWTRSVYRAYPYDKAAETVASDNQVRMVARGGSWYERPVDATASIRFAYVPYQKVFNVGFRVIIEE